MPRRPRNYLPGFPYPIVQRGNNRQACFFTEQDYALYLELLAAALPKYEVELHAFCLMTNHVHLLITPRHPLGISDTLKVVGSRYAQVINKQYQRTGTLWEGRHKSSVVDTESYLLKCYRYIELNPVAANMVARPEEYRWSSYHTNGWGDVDDLITPHPEYLRLGSDVETRCYQYRELFKTNLSEQDLHAFREAAHYCAPVGDDWFAEQISVLTGTKPISTLRGRPKKPA